MADSQNAPPTFSSGQAAVIVPVHQSKSNISVGLASAILAITALVFFFISIKIFFLFAAVYRQRRALQQQRQQQQQNVANGVLRYQRTVANSRGFLLNKGLSEIQIARMPARKYGEDCEGCCRQEGEEDCAVCLSEFVQGVEVKEMAPCGHVFHLTCIYTWLRQGDTCPMCRVSLRPPPRYRISTNPAAIPEQEPPIESIPHVDIHRQHAMRVGSEGATTRDVDEDRYPRPAGRSLSWAAISNDSSDNLAARWRVTLASWSAPSESRAVKTAGKSRLAPGSVDLLWAGDPLVDGGEGSEVAVDVNLVLLGILDVEESSKTADNSSISLEPDWSHNSLCSTELPSYQPAREGGTENILPAADCLVDNFEDWDQTLSSGSHFVNRRQRKEEQCVEKGASSEEVMGLEGEDWQEIDLEEGRVGHMRTR